ncbi:MAG: DUF4468 domain-containing protein [Tannerella sp.]|jgi:flavin reductase (DIM6/NTAB) family NADH-FMN oxidoreductase RutF|nr:DUF4468 domain-containing protein [Tannerella sp.]
MGRMIRFLMLALACIPAILWADDDRKYLAGAVPEVDGKVVFTRNFDLPGVDQNSIYEYVYNWLDNRMKANGNGSRIAFSEKEKGQIVASGEEYLVFSNSALSLDRSMMSYNLVILCKPGKCEMQLERIRYNYEDNKYTAEEQIADDVALNKKKTAIYRGYKKFRVKTIDYVDELFDGARIAFGIKGEDKPASLMATQTQQANVTLLSQEAPVTQTVSATNTAPVQTTEAPAVATVEAAASASSAAPVITETVTPAEPPVTTRPLEISQVDISASQAISQAIPHTESSSALSGYKQLAPDKIPGNIIKMLNEDWMLITAGTDSKFNMMTASWGGLGVLYGKPTAICFINPTRYTYQLMETNNTYTLTFYTEAYREALNYCGSHSGRDGDKVKGSGLTPITTPSGSKAFSEAWLIIECRKLVGQSLNHDALFDEKIKSDWVGKQLHKMYIGEIINVWVK